MTTPNLADALRGLLDRKYTLFWSKLARNRYAVTMCIGSEFISMKEGPDPAQLVLDLWTEVSVGKEGT